MRIYFCPDCICPSCRSHMAVVENAKEAEGRIVVECRRRECPAFERPYIVALPVLSALLAEPNLAEPGTFRCVVPPGRRVA